MTKPAKLFAAVLMLLLPAFVMADELADAAEGLCDSIKSCALEQLAKEDLTPEMRQMMQPMLDNMCVNLQGKVKAVPTGHALYKPAVACMRSMESLSCAEMQSSDRATTPECAEYEKLTREYVAAPAASE